MSTKAEPVVDEGIEAEVAATAAARELTLYRELFGSHGIAGDPAAVTATVRDAHLRCTNLLDPGAAVGSFRLAERIGDEPLARAIAAKSLEQGWQGLLEEFTAARPGTGELLAELQAVRAVPKPMVLTRQVMPGESLPVPVLHPYEAQMARRATKEA